MSQPKIGQFWAGQLFGTNTGKIFADFTTGDNGLTGTLRVRDDDFGIVQFSISGSFNGTQVEFRATSDQPPEGVNVGVVTVVADLTPEGHLRGTWQSSIGTGGPFVLYPHDYQGPAQRQTNLPASPEQLYTASAQLGTLRLYAEDVKELFESVCKDFPGSRPVVTFRKNGSEISKYYDDFEQEMAHLGALTYLKYVVQAPETANLNRVAIIELNAYGTNDIKVQGCNESWVVGKVESLARVLRRYESATLSNFRKWGLTLNQLIFLVMLVAIPDIDPMWNRVAFVGTVVLLMVGLSKAHAKLIPNAIVNFNMKPPTALQRMSPFILSAIIGISATVIGGLILMKLQKP